MLIGLNNKKKTRRGEKQKQKGRRLSFFIICQNNQSSFLRSEEKQFHCETTPKSAEICQMNFLIDVFHSSSQRVTYPSPSTNYSARNCHSSIMAINNASEIVTHWDKQDAMTSKISDGIHHTWRSSFCAAFIPHLRAEKGLDQEQAVLSYTNWKFHIHWTEWVHVHSNTSSDLYRIFDFTIIFYSRRITFSVRYNYLENITDVGMPPTQSAELKYSAKIPTAGWYL